MKVLVIGSGGREHALALKCAESSLVKEVFCAPGNPGMRHSKIRIANIGANEIQKLKQFALDCGIRLTIVGPEDPLAVGMVDEFRADGLKIFGPTKKAARIESWKPFAKDFFQRHGIPTAPYKTFTDFGDAKNYINKKGTPIVIKVAGLAAGKGVFVCQNKKEVAEAFKEIENGKFKKAADKIIVEDFLSGEEATFMAIVDANKNVLELPSSQDHKAVSRTDRRNTGGMGAYSPAPVITEEVRRRVMNEIVMPIVNGMHEEGNPYTGMLYVGLMIDKNGNPKVLECNCRFGDPEAEPVLMRLESDFVEIILAAIEGRLDTIKPLWNPAVAVTITLAAEGYPETPKKGDLICGIGDALDLGATLHFAGVGLKDNRLVTNGGRVMYVSAMGQTHEETIKKAYAYAREIRCSGLFFRDDIGHKALNR